MAVPAPTSAAAVPGSKLLDEANRPPRGSRGPGLDRRSQPYPRTRPPPRRARRGRRASKGVVRVRPAREPGRDTRGDAEVAQHERHRAGEVLAVATVRPSRTPRAAARRRPAADAGRREPAAVAQPRLDRDDRGIRRLHVPDDLLRGGIERRVRRRIGGEDAVHDRVPPRRSEGEGRSRPCPRRCPRRSTSGRSASSAQAPRETAAERSSTQRTSALPLRGRSRWS